MKKKIFCLMLSICFIIPCALLLSACGSKNCYCDISATPEHVSVDVSHDGGSATDKDGRLFFEKGQELTIAVTLDYGYELGDFKVYVNEKLLELSGDDTSYSAKFVCNEDFKITFEGSPIEKVNDITLDCDLDFANESCLDAVYIEFLNYENYTSLPQGTQGVFTLNQFNALVENQNVVIGVKQLENLDFIMYANGYTCGWTIGVNADRYVDTTFYQNGEKYGYKYSINFDSDSTLTICPNVDDAIQMNFDGLSHENAMYSASIDNSIGSVVGYADFANSARPTLTIVLNNYDVSEYKAVYDNMTLKINHTIIDDFKISETGVITLVLDKPYEYAFNDGKLDVYYANCYKISTNLVESFINAGLTVDVQSRTINCYADGSEISPSNEISFNIINAIKYTENGSYTFLKNSYVTYIVQFPENTDFTQLSINGTTVTIGDESSSDIRVTSAVEDFDDVPYKLYQIEVRAEYANFDRIDFIN